MNNEKHWLIEGSEFCFQYQHIMDQNKNKISISNGGTTTRQTILMSVIHIIIRVFVCHQCLTMLVYEDGVIASGTLSAAKLWEIVPPVYWCNFELRRIKKKPDGLPTEALKNSDWLSDIVL